jgi:hypothetical protein
VPFAFKGIFNKLAFRLGPGQLKGEGKNRAQRAMLAKA